MQARNPAATGSDAPRETFNADRDAPAPDGKQDDGFPPVKAVDLISDRALEAAEQDEFRHQTLADRVADLVTEADAPLNVALFGPWGSGKSSIAGFLKENLQRPERGGAVAFAYYDAWKYGGESLRRNFISRAAAELRLPAEDPRFEPFYRGLYQTTRRVRLKDREVGRAVMVGLGLLALLFLALNIVTAVGAGLVSVVTNEDFAGEIGRVLPKSLAGTGLAAMAAAVTTAVLTFAKLDIEESAPSADEEFNDTFRRLVREVRIGPMPGPVALWGWNRRRSASPCEQAGGPDRIVFFVDELDRCTEADVVTTLVAVRTFLDEKHCVFVVAADRAVLEAALEKAAEQETPTNEDAPYYATAGAFLDKVFQHQLTIPPLRTRRLSRFAREQVAQKPHGVWKELRDAGLLDDVVYALIPAHVRSPRRVKVLLNNFAVNARIAQSRGIEWPGRAEEIAKLTVLQTEYSALADDLHIEPRLPRLLLEPSSAEAQGPRAKPLVVRHTLKESSTTSGVPGRDPTAFIDEVPGKPSLGDEQARLARHAEMRNRQRQELRRYLERVVNIEGPHRDLLYLEAAGEAVDLNDPTLGDAIEDLAPDKPEEIARLLVGKDVGDKLAAARLLASMLEDLVRRERTNVMTALTALTVDIGEDMTVEVAAALAKSIRTFQRPDDLEPSHLPGVLEVALVAADDALAEDVLAEDDLWSEPSQVATVAMHWGRLPSAGQARLAREVARVLIDEPAVIATLLGVLAEERSVEILRTATVRSAIENAYDAHSGQLTALSGGLLDASLSGERPRPSQLGETVALLRATHGSTYEVLKGRAAQITRALPRPRRAGWVLRMWAAAPVEDWGRWAELLSGPRKKEARDPADAVLVRLFGDWAAVPLDEESTVVEHVEKVVPYVRPAEGKTPAFIRTLQAALTDRWEATDTNVQSRENFHRAAAATRSIGGQTSEQVEKALATDLREQLEVGATPQMFDAIARMATKLSPASILQVGEHLHQHDPASAPDEAVPELTARATLALEVKARGQSAWRREPLAISYNDELRHLLGRQDVEGLVTRWFGLEPSPTAARFVLRAHSGEPSPELQAAVERWAGDRRKTERTSVVMGLLRQEKPNSDLIAPLTRAGVTQAQLAREAVKLATESRTAESRLIFASKVGALRLSSPRPRQLIADAAVDRLESGVKSDISVAVALVTGLGSGLPRLATLKQRFAAAATQHGYKFSKEEAEALVRAGITPPQDSVGKKIWRALFSK